MNRSYRYDELANRANYEEFAHRTAPTPPRPVPSQGTDVVRDHARSDSRATLWQYILFLELHLTLAYYQVDNARRDEAAARRAYEALWKRSEAAFSKLAAVEAALHPEGTDGATATGTDGGN